MRGTESLRRKVSGNAQVQGPWYRASKGTWYATVEGRKVSLGVKGPESRKEAVTAWHRLMADPPKPKPKPEPKSKPTTVRQVADAFLADVRLRLKPATVGRYEYDLEAFCRKLGNLPAGKLAHQAVAGWLSEMNGSGTYKAIALRSVSACLGWAARQELIPDNPVRKVAKPKSRSRSEEAIISEEEHGKLSEVASKDFRLVLRILWATGCRPGEVGSITAENFDPETGLVKLAEHKTDKTGKPRLIFLPPDIAAELRRLSERFKTGALLRSRQGNAWTGRAITKAMGRLKRLTGVKAIAYGYRHTFATDALANGVPDAQVAALLGHSSTTMLHKHYSHLTSRAEVLRQAASLVR